VKETGTSSARPPFTISIGAVFAPDGSVSSDSMIRRADKALYQAKDTGRNRVVLA
jgi:diguanylate cyclase (GGDEF)-like protein